MYAARLAVKRAGLHLSGSRPDVETSWQLNWSVYAGYRTLQRENKDKGLSRCGESQENSNTFLPLSTLVIDVMVLLDDKVTDDVLFRLSLIVVRPAAGLPGPLCDVLTKGGEGEGDGR
jgi:hypothetical protein